MDNYNGQNQYQQPQMQYQQTPVQPQNQYQQTPVQPQNQYQQAPVQAPVQPQSGGLKWLFVIGVPILLGIATLVILLLVGFIEQSYDIGDYHDVKEACSEVFAMKIHTYDYIEDYYAELGIEEMAYGSDDKSRYDVYVSWYRFTSDKKAEAYYDDLVEVLWEDYSDEKYDVEDYDWESDDDLTEAYLIENDEIDKVMIIKDNECIMYITMVGDASLVDILSYEFIDAID